MERIREELEACGVDVKGALNRMMGNEELFLRLMKKFLEDKNYAGLLSNLDKNNYEEAFKCAHTLKGVAGNLGLDPIMESAIIIVEKLRRRETQGLWDDMSKLTESYNKICEILNKMQ